MIFNEFESMDPMRLLGFWLGVAVTMAGLFVLAVYQAKRARIQEEEDKALEAARKAAASRAVPDGTSRDATPTMVRISPAANGNGHACNGHAEDVEKNQQDEAAAAPEQIEPQITPSGVMVPEGYVRDLRCYLCGCLLPCWKQCW